MLKINNGKLYNDLSPWVRCVVKDSKNGNIYEVLWSGTDVYIELSTDDIINLDLMDEINGFTYRIFIHDGLVFTLCIKDNLSVYGYGSECFISVGSTLVTLINPASEIKLFDLSSKEFLFIDTVSNENSTRFTVPVAGKFLIIKKGLSELYSYKEIEVHPYSFTEIINELTKIDTIVNKEKFKMYL